MFASMQDVADPKPHLTEPPLLEVRALSKSFGALRALDGVDFTPQAGQIHALLGGNGAGKSSLIKVSSAVLSPDGGVVRLQAVEVAPRSSREPVDAGIATVYAKGSPLPNASL